MTDSPTSSTARAIRVVYSNRIERLVDSLAAALYRDRSIDRLFDRPRVVVPNRNVEKYLKFELADRFGVVGDVTFSTLEAWLRDALPEEVVPLDEDRLASGLLGIFSSAAVEEDPALEPVRSYLEADGTEGRPVRARQLSARLARNFIEYGHSRVRMLDQWRQGDGPYTSTQEYRRTEAWQRALWERLFGPDGLLERASEEGETPRLLTEYWRRADPSSRDDLPEEVHLFGLSHVAPVYGQIFEGLSRAVDLHFFVLNPCRHYWEDVVYDEEEELIEADREVAPGDLMLPLDNRRAEDRGTLPGAHMTVTPDEPADAPLALNLWGRAGRDHVHMLNRLTDYDPLDRWVDPAAEPTGGEEPSLLESFQSDVLNFVPAAASARDPSVDDSIRFIEAPGLRRELEAVADAIWRLVLEEDVAFNDIAVILNPRRREEYQMHLEAVFEEARGIPFNQVDAQRGDGSRLLQAAERLIELPLGDFDRRELGSLLVHPNVLANHDDADPAEWERRLEELGIFHGADAEDHADTHIDRDLYNWDQGVTRLVLGAFLEERGRGDEHARPFELAGETYLPRGPAETEEVESAGGWIALVRRLIAEAKATRRREDDLGGWLNWMADWIDAHLAPEDTGEEAELSGYLEALRTTAEGDLSGAASDGGTVPYRAAVEFARSQLASQTYERGHYLATGVVVSSFVPQRPIPFEAIFTTGLSAQDFPASSPRTPIDLRTAEWQEGDLWDRDRERYMFFETLLSARRRVTCSWVARDPVTGDDIEPSSVVREFQYILDEYLDEGVDELVRRHPLRRFDPTYFDDSTDSNLEPTLHPSARGEVRAQELRSRLVEASGGTETRELDVRAAAEALDSTGSDGAEMFGLVDPPEVEEDSDEPVDETRLLRFAAFRDFLVSPLQGWARWRLGMRPDREESLLDETDEPFELSPLDESRILREGFERTMHENQAVEPEALEATLSDELDRAILDARAPTGVYSRVAQGELSTTARAWAEQFEAAAPTSPRRYRIGGPAGRDAVESIDAPVLTIERGEERRRLELIGDTDLVDPERARVFVPTRKRSYRLRWHHALRGWVQGLVLSAAEVLDGDRVTVSLLATDTESPTDYAFDGMAPSEARDQLGALGEELWFDPHAYRFAISELEEAVDEEGCVDPERLQTEVWSADDSDRGASRDAYGPVANVHRYDIPSTDGEVLTAMLERRLGGFVASLRSASD
ncbi:MAG: exodeoxyribonuclease V subunit gamma [Bradymonadaceae bacterium]